MPGMLTPLEEDLLAALDAAAIARHAARLRELTSNAAGSGEDGAIRLMTYIRAEVRAWDVPVTLHRFTAPVAVPGPARFTLARRDAPVEALALPGSGATPAEGITAELQVVPPDLDATDAAPDVGGAIALVDGPPTPELVATIAARGALGQVYVSPDETLRPTPLATPDGEPPDTPVILIGRAAGEGFRALRSAGPTPVALRARPGWEERRLALPVAAIAGIEEPDDFVVAGAGLGPASNGAPATWDAAGLLELCRVLAQHAPRLRRGLRLAWWPPGGGASWYVDRAWEDLGRHGAAYLDLANLGQSSATAPHAAPPLRWFLETTLREGGAGHAGQTAGAPHGGSVPFARLGLPTLGLGPGLAAADPDAAAVARDAALDAVLLARLCTSPLLPFDLVATARPIEEEIGAVLRAGGDAADLATLPARAAGLRAAAERFQLAALHIAQADSPHYEEGLDLANRALRQAVRRLIPLLHRSGEPYRPAPITAAPLPALDPARALAAAPDAAPPLDTHRLRAAAARERNRLIDALNAATDALNAALDALRPLGLG